MAEVENLGRAMVIVPLASSLGRIPPSWQALIDSNPEAGIGVVSAVGDERTGELFCTFQSRHLPAWKVGVMPHVYDSFQDLVIAACRRAHGVEMVDG